MGMVLPGHRVATGIFQDGLYLQQSLERVPS